MNTDLSFITNEKDHSLKERFNVLIKSTDFFDCLVGYFYSSGFYAIYPSLETTEKIRILIGISTNREVFEMLKTNKSTQQTLEFSHAEAKKKVENLIQQEMGDSEDSRDVEEGAYKFIDWIDSGKLEIRAYPSRNIHAKLYIMTFKEGDRDTGRVITGSSNFTQAGLVDNLEFNVELKNRSDYYFAKNKFEELWCNAVAVSDRYVDTIQKKTWLNRNITPYQLYLKFLYEYFKDELNQTDDVFVRFLPPEFKKLEYQKQAVLNAKKIVLEYGGVFISDVVGLGKTYISAMLAGQLDGRTLVIAPPALLEKSNTGSWPNVFSDFRVQQSDFKSIGKLDNLLDRGTDKYTNIIIDEAHRFRTETTITYEKLAEICRGKRVILVTATPYNNTSGDILSLLKLFQNGKKSTIPNLPDLESFFNRMDKKLKKLDRKKNYSEYINTAKENAREIRNKVLKYLMVRRTRSEIVKYFSKDIREQGLKFPEVKKPEPLFYELDDKEDEIFNKTIDLIANRFKYARYTPMLYYTGKINRLEEQSQRNMGRFMKVLLVKRLESSFFAFRNSVDRFIHSYEMFIRELENGNVYVSKKHINKIFELLENDDDKAVQHLIDENKAEKYESKYFREELKIDLQHDYNILKDIERLWHNVIRDPKLIKFKIELSKNEVLKKNHLVIFTESKETANYLYTHLTEDYPGKVLLFTGDSGESVRDRVTENFDARARYKKNDYRILVSTEVLSEGVNLHRANVVINYDIPWNPTRMMQRVGRINRIDTPFDVIHTFNFFPTMQSNDQIKLKEAAEGKINAFLTLLGGDAELLTEGEPIGSHELFDRLTSKRALEGDEDAEESELKYLQVIRDIRENDPHLFEQIKQLPKKARTAKRNVDFAGSLITYFRREKLQKFFMARIDEPAKEIDFLTAAKLCKSMPDEKKKGLPMDMYDLLDSNKEAFMLATTVEMVEPQKRRGSRSSLQILNILKATMKNTQKLTDDQEFYLKKVFAGIRQGSLPGQTSKKTIKALDELGEGLVNPFKVLAVLQTHIPERLLKSHYAGQNREVPGKREVILSLYLAG